MLIMSRGVIVCLSIFLQLLVSFSDNFADAKGPTCLNCRHVIGPRHCHSVTVCREDEMCVTHMYNSSNGEKLFDVGCYSKNSCPVPESSDTTHKYTSSPYLCTQCCHGDLCNDKGCGENGYPIDRGSICLTCPQTRNASLCDMISVCQTDEMCHIQEINEFDETYFITKCAAKSVCNSHLIEEIGFGRRNIETKRASVQCSTCCSGDLCNYRCSHGHTHTTETGHSTVSMTFTPQTSPLSPLTSLFPISSSVSQGQTSNAQVTLTTPTFPVTSSPSTHLGHYGTDFMVVFPHVHQFIDKIELIITAVKDTVVTIESPNPGINRTITVSASIGAIVELPNSIQLVGSAIESKGIYVKSQNDIAVFGVEHSTLVKEVEGFYVLPMHKLGLFYMANSHYKFNVAVVAAEDNTCISFTDGYYDTVTYNSRTYNYNESFSVCINKFDSLQLRATHYIMGFKIQSDKKIGVLSFDEFSGPTGGADNIFLEYLPPVSDFGSHFILPSFFRSDKNMKIFYAYSTQYTPSPFIWQLYKIFPTQRVYHSWFRINNTAFAFDSSDSVLLMSYSDNGKLHIKPFMTQIPAISQYSNNYKIRTPSTDTFDNYICAIILSNNANGLLIDGQSLIERSRTRETISVQLQDYDVMNVNITNGHHVILHPDPNVMFGLISYGYSTRGGGSYAFPAGL